jgi:hypothetical protein
MRRKPSGLGGPNALCYRCRAPHGQLEHDALEALERVRTADTPTDVSAAVPEPSVALRPSYAPTEGARWRMEIEEDA